MRSPADASTRSTMSTTLDREARAHGARVSIGERRARTSPAPESGFRRQQTGPRDRRDGLCRRGGGARACWRTAARCACWCGRHSDRRNIAGLDVEQRDRLARGWRLARRRRSTGCGALYHVAADYRLWVRDHERDVSRQCRRHAAPDGGGARRRASSASSIPAASRRSASSATARRRRRDHAEHARRHDRPL